MSEPEADSPPEGARKALIEAALHLAAEKGFAATSTREITARAGVNLALIAYHFGGKEGLRLACGAEIARRMRRAAGAPGPIPETAPEARQRLDTMLRGVVGFLCAEGSAPLVAFLLQEVMQGGPVLEAIYSAFISPKHDEITALWARASGRAADERMRLQVFALLGQVLYFRIARRVVTAKMGGPVAPDTIAEVLSANLAALLEAP